VSQLHIRTLDNAQSNDIGGGYNYDSAAIRSRYDHSTACVCRLLRCGPGGLRSASSRWKRIL